MPGNRKLTIVLAVLVAVVFGLAMPSALRSALQRGDFYVFSTLFFSELAPRLSGPGKLRFIIQPLVALLLGLRDGAKDARAGRKPYLWALVSGGHSRRELLRSAFASIANLVLVAILLDSIAQWLIFRVVQPGAALIIGPVLISAPYSIVRSLVCRTLSLRRA